MSSSHRFWPPWVIDETNSSCIIVRDVTEQALGYFYLEEVSLELADIDRRRC